MKLRLIERDKFKSNFILSNLKRYPFVCKTSRSTTISLIVVETLNTIKILNILQQAKKEVIVKLVPFEIDFYNDIKKEVTLLCCL